MIIYTNKRFNLKQIAFQQTFKRQASVPKTTSIAEEDQSSMMSSPGRTDRSMQDFIEDLDQLRHAYSSDKAPFNASLIGARFEASKNKLIDFVKNNECEDRLPVLRAGNPIDLDTMNLFNVPDNFERINTYLTNIRNISMLDTTALRNVSKDVVDNLLKHSVSTNNDFKEFIESNMNSSLTLESFPNLFTYIIQTYGDVPLKDLCKTILSATSLLEETPSFTEDARVHEAYLEILEEDKAGVDDRISSAQENHDKDRKDLNEKKIFPGLASLLNTSLKFISNYSSIAFKSVVVMGVFGALYKNPALLSEVQLMLKSATQVSDFSLPSPSVDDVVPAASGSNHPVRKMDRAFLWIRGYAVKLFGDPNDSKSFLVNLLEFDSLND